MSMNKRKLPKAITRPTDELRQAAAERLAEADRTALAPELQLEQAPHHELAVHELAVPVREGEVMEPTAMPLTPSRLERPLPTRHVSPLDVNAVRRRTQAYAIVERHATYSAAGGIIPVPLVNVASVTAIIVRMVRRLSSLYGVPFERDRARAIVVALAGGTMPTGLAAVTTSTLYYFVPGSAIIGLAVASVAAVACTRNIGRVFVEHFESGATLQDSSVPTR
jgi:uncharacterized protein (DUF697 family)